jgi:uncharacterized protein (DUF433 family)
MQSPQAKDTGKPHFVPRLSAELVPRASQPESLEAGVVVPLCVGQERPEPDILREGGAPAMENLDWSKCPAVESIPGKVSGAWVFRNSRTPVKLVFENLEDGMTIDEIMEQYPVSRDEITAVLDFVTHTLDSNGT